MAKEDWGNLGDEIKNLVESAIDSQDYKTLNESLEKTVNSALNSVEESLRRTGQLHHSKRDTVKQDEGRKTGTRQRRTDYRSRTVRNPRKGQAVRAPQIVKNSPVYGSTWGLQGGGMALSICGGILSGGLGLAMFILLLIGILTGSMGFGAALGVGVMAPLLAMSGLLTYKGMNMLGRLKRFRSYIRQLGSRTYCSVRELAGCVGKSENYVRKDLRKMIQKRMFRQGHLDKTGGCLMVTDEAWDQYLEAEKQLAVREAEKQRIEIKEQEQAKETEGIPEEVRKVIAEGQSYLQKIRESNEAISDKKVSEKISRMELIVEKILERVQEHPELISDLSKFMEYYLPTTVKLLGAYEELDAQPVQGVNIISSKKEIENSLDTINHAFENLLDSFFQDAAWDISSDISVLQMMLAQEGLTDDGLSGKTTEEQERKQ